MNNELWMIHSTYDGDSTVIRACDYIGFCVSTDRDHWSFNVTVVEFGKFGSEQNDVDVRDLNNKVDRLRLEN